MKGWPAIKAVSSCQPDVFCVTRRTWKGEWNCMWFKILCLCILRHSLFYILFILFYFIFSFPYSPNPKHDDWQGAPALGGTHHCHMNSHVSSQCFFLFLFHYLARNLSDSEMQNFWDILSQSWYMYQRSTFSHWDLYLDEHDSDTPQAICLIKD